MIIETLLNVIKSFLSLVMAFEIPPLPDDMSAYLATLFEYLGNAVGLVANYVPMELVAPMFMFVFALEIGIMTYKIVMWIIRKIPVLGMS